MFRAELPSGTPLVALWLTIAGAAVVGGYAVMGKLAVFPLDAVPLILLAMPSPRASRWATFSRWPCRTAKRPWPWPTSPWRRSASSRSWAAWRGWPATGRAVRVSRGSSSTSRR